MKTYIRRLQSLVVVVIALKERALHVERIVIGMVYGQIRVAWLGDNAAPPKNCVNKRYEADKMPK